MNLRGSFEFPKREKSVIEKIQQEGPVSPRGEKPNPEDNELTSETMKDSLQQLSGNYEDQYAAAGFPPKICTLMLKELSDVHKLKCQVLDIGCGKGYVGEYLKKDGFLHITGMDCSKNLLEIAKTKKAYERLDRIAIGESETDPSHDGKYDFVISATMLNNDGWNEDVFLQCLRYLKMGGFVIFTTKLNLHNENQYLEDISKISDGHYWKFVTEHTFYRYDKLCDGKGKFSNKMVKVMAYQKTDNSVWEAEQAVIKAEAEKLAKKKKEEYDAMIKEKKAKLEGAANAAKARRMLNEKRKSDQLADEENAIKNAEEEERLAAEKAVQRKANQQRMMENLKKKIKELMWIKLKENQ